MRCVADIAPGDWYRDSDGLFKIVSHDDDGATTVQKEDGTRWVIANPEAYPARSTPTTRKGGSQCPVLGR